MIQKSENSNTHSFLNYAYTIKIKNKKYSTLLISVGINLAICLHIVVVIGLLLYRYKIQRKDQGFRRAYNMFWVLIFVLNNKKNSTCSVAITWYNPVAKCLISDSSPKLDHKES